MLNPLKLASTLLSDSAEAKGKRGELQSSFMLTMGLNKQYHIYNDVTLYIKNDKVTNDTTQIDHLIISPFGIFVIEIKNYSGWIYGSENQYKWTQVLNKNSKNQFLNPLIQNKKHVQVVQDIFNVADEHIYSVVVFMNKATFKTDMPDNVLHLQNMLGFIKKHTVTHLSDTKLKQCQIRLENRKLAKGSIANTVHMAKMDEKQNAKQTINASQQTPVTNKSSKPINKPSNSIANDKNHTENNAQSNASINTANQTTATNTDSIICPKCGSDMVKRVAKKGKNAGNTFYGCSNFPKCRFLLNC